MVSAYVILLAKAAWVAAKDAEVAAKVRTASMMAKKSWGDIEIDCIGGAEVLGPAEYEGTGGTGGAEEAGDAGSGTVTDGGYGNWNLGLLNRHYRRRLILYWIIICWLILCHIYEWEVRSTRHELQLLYSKYGLVNTMEL